MSNLGIANAILQQLGGHKFITMTGANGFLGGNDYLLFMLPKGCKNGVNKVKIRQDHPDTYSIDFMLVTTKQNRTVSSHANVCNSKLQELFTQETGMYTLFI